MEPTPDVVILPAFDDLPGLPGEAAQWHSQYEFDHRIEIEGLTDELLIAAEGIAMVPTGIGKTAAATTTTALLSSERVDLSESTFLTVGVAGGPPDLPVGSVVIADAVVDWDDKCRFDPEPGEELPLALNPYTESQGVFLLNEQLVAAAVGHAKSVGVSSGGEGVQESTSHSHEAGEARIERGVNLCGDELWHGEVLAGQATWLLEQYGVGPYRVTEMEDAGTAAALDRFGVLDRYLSIRGISNHDRPVARGSARENFFSEKFESGFDRGLRNAVSVAQALLEEGILQRAEDDTGEE